MPLSSGTVDTTGTDIQSDDPRKVARWVAEITLYDRETQTWYERGKRILRRYKDERSPIGGDDSRTRYNVLWSNTQTLQPALYSRNPKPDIQRRFKDADPVGRVTSDILERSAAYFCDTDGFGSAMRNCVMDFLLPGRGTVWLRYVPHMSQPTEVTDDAVEGETSGGDTIEYEEVCTDYVHASDFGHNICRTWEEVTAVWRKVYLTRDELTKRFGEEKGKLPPLDYVATSLNDTKLDDGIGKSTIYELWDKTRKCAVWFHKTVPEALDYRPDPLRLDGFFPCPRPIFSNLCNDSLIPTPFYVEYQDQARELDNLTARIGSLTKSIKVAGCYDASVQALGRILSEGVDNTMIPVESWALLADKGGLQGAMSFLPLKEIAEALLGLYQAREQVKKDLHEISGIPDIVRGDSNPNETLGAQQIKTSFATNRISDQQREIQRFARETIRIMVDIICGHFQIETIKTISGVRLLTGQEKQLYAPKPPMMGPNGQPMPAPPPPPLPPNVSPDQMEDMMAGPTWEDVEGLMRNQALRCFRIDIETDSTIKADEQQEQASRIEFLKAIGEYMANALPAGQQHPELVPVLLEGLMFLARSFSVGKGMEGALNIAVQKLEKIAKNPPQRPDPEMEKIKADAATEQAKMQGTAQIEQMKQQFAMEAKQADLQADVQKETAKAQAQMAQQQHLNELENQRRLAELAGEKELEQYKADLAAQVEQAKIAQADRLAQIENDREILKARIAQETAIAVANINAAAKADQAAEAQAQDRDDQIEGAVPDKELHAKIEQLVQAFNVMAKAQDMASKGANDNIDKIHKALSAEKEIVRDPKTGKPTGVRIKPDTKALAKQLRN